MNMSISTIAPDVAVVTSAEPLITDVSSALDLIATVNYQTGCSKMAIEKSAVCEEFFTLSNGLAGEILQKFVNYRMKLAIAGDFSGYTSKALADFMRESNEQKLVNFLPDLAACEQALAGY